MRAKLASYALKIPDVSGAVSPWSSVQPDCFHRAQSPGTSTCLGCLGSNRVVWVESYSKCVPGSDCSVMYGQRDRWQGGSPDRRGPPCRAWVLPIRKMSSWLGRGDQIFFRAKRNCICLNEQERTKSKRSLTLQRG